MSNLFRRRSSAPTSRTRLGVESLDSRDMPSAVLPGQEPCGNEIRIPIPVNRGCWPGPSPLHDAGSLIAIGGVNTTPVQTVQVGMSL